MPLVPVIGLSITEIYDLPICESLYYVCYLLDLNKEKETQIKKLQMKNRLR